MVPKTVSLHFIEMLNVLQQKKAEQKSYDVTMENRLNFEKLNTAIGTKRLRQAQITDLIDHEAIALADSKVARYFFLYKSFFQLLRRCVLQRDDKRRKSSLCKTHLRKS